MMSLLDYSEYSYSDENDLNNFGDHCEMENGSPEKCACYKIFYSGIDPGYLSHDCYYGVLINKTVSGRCKLYLI